MSALPSRWNSDRLVSLDAFRGFTIAAMVLVNNPGDWDRVYSQLLHAKWHGWTFTDWIFPFFLFICGVSMALSLARRGREGADRRSLALGLARRGAIIFAIGLGLNFIPDFDLGTLRIPGVLQRIGLCVVLAAPLVAYGSWRQQLAWIVGLLTFHACVMLFVPVADAEGRVAAGALEPGRDAGAYIDRLVMGGHLWAKAKTWDPEGLLGTLPALASLLFGVLAGHWLLSRTGAAEKTVWLMLAGLGCLWIGAILDVVVMPINKMLWTAAYCVFMTGWGLLVFAAFYWLMDADPSDTLRRRSRSALLPLTIYGMNALFIFALSGLAARMLALKLPGSTQTLKAMLYQPIEALPLSALNTSLLFAILFDLVMFAVAWAMWRRGWFVKV